MYIPTTTLLQSSAPPLYDFAIVGADATAIDTAVDGVSGPLSGSYALLEVYALLRTDDAGAAANAQFVLNNDTSSIYDFQRVSAVTTTVSGSATQLAANWQVQVHGSGGTADYASPYEIIIPGYAGTVFNKVGTLRSNTLDGTAGNNQVYLAAVGYRSTSAITRIKVTAVGGAKLKVGSRLTVYAR